MADISNVIKAYSSASNLVDKRSATSNSKIPSSKKDNSFEDLVSDFVDLGKEVEKQTLDSSMQNNPKDITDIAVKAVELEVTLKTIVKVRDTFIANYKEVLNMQI